LYENNGKNSYQVQNILKKSENFTIDEYYGILHHGVNQSYGVTLKLENEQTMFIGLKSILL